MSNLERLKYPIGKYQPPAIISLDWIQGCIDELANFPMELDHLTRNLSADELEKKYRDGGWSVRQIIHHLADSHVNAYTRTKLTLTEHLPIIRPYHEERWAELPDARTGDIAGSLNLLHAIHNRWVGTLRQLQPENFECQYIHPDVDHPLTLAYLIGNYVWHGNHHIAHILLTKS